MPRHELIDLELACACACSYIEGSGARAVSAGFFSHAPTDHELELAIAIQPAAELIDYVQAKGHQNARNVNVKNQVLLVCKKSEATRTVEKRTAVKPAQSPV